MKKVRSAMVAIFLAFMCCVEVEARQWDDLSTPAINEGAVGQYDDLSTPDINEGAVGKYDDLATPHVNEGALPGWRHD